MVPRPRELPGQPRIQQIAEQAAMLHGKYSATFLRTPPAAAIPIPARQPVHSQLIAPGSCCQVALTWILASHGERGLLNRHGFTPVQWGLSVLSHWGHPKKIRGRQCFS